MTYIPTGEGWLYLAVVLDLFSRRIVGWAMGEAITAELACHALDMAWYSRLPAPGLIFHSDRGSQYASHRYTEPFAEHGMKASMSGKGNCWDNACSETLFGSLKVERLHGMEFATHREAKDARLDWLLVQRIEDAIDVALPQPSSVRAESNRSTRLRSLTAMVQPQPYGSKDELFAFRLNKR